MRAVRALVHDGLVTGATELAGRDRRRTAESRERDGVLRTVAAVVGVSPTASLREIGDKPAALRCDCPRGGAHWSTSSVAHLLKTARRQRLVEESAGED